MAQTKTKNKFSKNKSSTIINQWLLNLVSFIFIKKKLSMEGIFSTLYKLFLRIFIILQRTFTKNLKPLEKKL